MGDGGGGGGGGDSIGMGEPGGPGNIGGIGPQGMDGAMAGDFGGPAAGDFGPAAGGPDGGGPADIPVQWYPTDSPPAPKYQVPDFTINPNQVPNDLSGWGQQPRIVRYYQPPQMDPIQTMPLRYKPPVDWNSFFTLFGGK